MKTDTNPIPTASSLPPLLSRSVSVSVYLGVCLTLFLPVSLSLSDTSLAPTRVRKPAHLPRPSQTTPLLAFHAKATADDMLSLLHEKIIKKDILPLEQSVSFF